MYQKIGKKIMELAEFSSKLTIGACIILELLILFTAPELWLYGLVVFTIIGYASYVSTWVIYGFGQLIDDVNAIRRNTEKADDYDDELPRL